MHKRKARACLIKAEQIELPSEDAMVSFFCLFEPVEVFIEFLFCRPAGAIDPLEHFLCRVAVPVCTCDGHNLEAADFACAGDMRASTEVLEAVAVRIETYYITFGAVDIVGFIFVGGQFGQVHPACVISFLIKGLSAFTISCIFCSMRSKSVGLIGSSRSIS